MAEVPPGYQEVPEEDRRKAKVFFDRAQTVAGTGNFDYAIEMYIQGLNLDPDAVDAHQSLRDISLKRKASGGKDMGMFEKMKYKKASRDDKSNMLNAERLLAYDPGNTENMVGILQNAHRAGFFDTCIWMAPILMKANADSKSPDFGKFIVQKDIMVNLKQWKLATDAAHYAAMLRPGDMDLQTELKNLGAQQTMDTGGYTSGGSFRNSVKDMAKQESLFNADKDVRTDDQLSRMVADAEAEWKADPKEAGKLRKYIDALEKTERPAFEQQAIDVLQETFDRTKQFSFRHRLGQIRMKQWSREERVKRTALQQNPKDEKAVKAYQQFKTEQTQFELDEYTLWADNYPTEMRWKYDVGMRLFMLQRYDEAIPTLQDARRDPKLRTDATVFLGRAFLDAGFVDEAAETLEQIINEYQLKGDAKSKEMYYWRARAMEQKNQPDVAIKSYSQIAQWDFNYRDVQSRIKRLRGGSNTGGSQPPPAREKDTIT